MQKRNENLEDWSELERKPFPNLQYRLSYAATVSDSSCQSSSDNDSDESDFEENQLPPTFMERIDSFNEQKFQLHMRMKRKTVDYLISRYTQFLATSSYAERERIDARTSVHMYLWYMGTVISFRQLGRLFRVSMLSAWIAVRQVTACVNKFGHEFIKWPQGAEIKATQDRFQQTRGIPGVIGVIGCTHIKIRAPRLARFFCLHVNQSYSLALQAVVDGQGKFIDITCEEPGSLHDTEVLLRSDLYDRVKTSYEEVFPQNSIILGGAAYPLTSWLVTPFKDGAGMTESQRKFNKMHQATRAVGKDTLDQVKRRFPRLMKFTEDINVCATKSLIMGACILHNLCLDHKDFYDDLYSVYSYGFSSTGNKPIYESSAVADTGCGRRDELFEALKELNVI